MMARDEGIDTLIAELQAQKSSHVPPPPPPPFPPESGGGIPDDMEARIVRLEAHMEHVREAVTKVGTDTSDLKKSVSELKTDQIKWFGEIKTDISNGFGGLNTKLAATDAELKHRPTYWQTFGIVTACVAVIGTILTMASRLI